MDATAVLIRRTPRRQSADIFKSKTLITLGESEVESGQVTVKNNHNREEITVSLDQIQENYQLIFEKLGF